MGKKLIPWIISGSPENQVACAAPSPHTAPPLLAEASRRGGLVLDVAGCCRSNCGADGWPARSSARAGGAGAQPRARKAVNIAALVEPAAAPRASAISIDPALQKGRTECCGGAEHPGPTEGRIQGRAAPPASEYCSCAAGASLCPARRAAPISPWSHLPRAPLHRRPSPPSPHLII